LLVVQISSLLLRSVARSRRQAQKSLARKSEIRGTNQGDLGRPDGREKISGFSSAFNKWFLRAIPPRQEGRMRYRHET
jgi:hypothetical protein